MTAPRISESVTIILPLPPAILSPNRVHGSYGGRMARYAASKRYRRLAKDAALEQQRATAPWDKATVQATFYHGSRRRRDDVNALQMLKSGYDGIVESGLLVDDDHEHLTTLPATFRIDRECPRVELLISRQ